MNADSPPATSRRWRTTDPLPYLANIAWLAGAPIVAIGAAASTGLALWPSGLLAVVITSAILAAHRQQTAGRFFGIANGVTLVRVNLTVIVLVACGTALASPTAELHLTWAIFAVAGAALLMDGLDGWLARRRQEASDFGERFDMAADTAFTIALTLTLLTFGLTGPWVLAIGLLRPLFLVLGRCRPWLRAPLAPCRLRKVLCALALCLLVAALAPPLIGIAPLLAGASLAILVFSFGRDLWHLAEHRFLA